MAVSKVEEILAHAHTRIGDLHKHHMKHADIPFPLHVFEKRKSLHIDHESKKIIYFDTNAWKCISDYIRKKPALTPEMIRFAELATDNTILDKCIFPIGLPTLFELQSMTDPLTIESLSTFIDQHSKNTCIAFDMERIEFELKYFINEANNSINLRNLFYRRPFELFGIPTAELPPQWKTQFDTLAFNKALYDLLCELPVSVQLSIALERSGDKWDNTKGITELNKGKTEHQDEIVNYNTAVFIELAGIFSLFFDEEPRINGMVQPKYYAAMAMLHWKDNPKSNQLITARVLANLHGLMRFETSRVFKNGDIADFSTAAAALPIADAFFTDKRLAYIASDAHTEIKRFCDCDIVFGFANFATYLQKVHQA